MNGVVAFAANHGYIFADMVAKRVIAFAACHCDFITGVVCESIVAFVTRHGGVIAAPIFYGIIARAADNCRIGSICRIAVRPVINCVVSCARVD